MLVGFDRFIGGPGSMDEWDKEAEFCPHLRSNMGFLCQQLPRLLEAGAEMWPMDPTMLYSGGQGGCRTRTASSSWQRGTRRSRGWPFRCVCSARRDTLSRRSATRTPASLGTTRGSVVRELGLGSPKTTSHSRPERSRRSSRQAEAGETLGVGVRGGCCRRHCCRGAGGIAEQGSLCFRPCDDVATTVVNGRISGSPTPADTASMNGDT